MDCVTFLSDSAEPCSSGENDPAATLGPSPVPLVQTLPSSQAWNVGIMARSQRLYSPVADYVISLNPHFWFLEKFEPKLTPYLICGLYWGGGLLGSGEGILTAPLLFSLDCFTWSLFRGYSCPCPLDKTILDILFFTVLMFINSYLFVS